MTDLIIYFFTLLVLVFIVTSVYDISKNKLLTNREKTNYLFLVFVIPFGGTLIYYIFFRKRRMLN